jgi:ubiquinone/menaquinone biosynthesis C-methylase UbiE
MVILPEQSFDTVAADYDTFRPGYVQELYQRVFSYMPVSRASLAAEIGIGTGQATRPVLKTGCSVHAVECGAALSALCREKFKDCRNFSIVTGRFEDTSFDENRYDLVYSATAFHWIPEQAGYSKVFAMLKSGGAFARFANRPFLCREQPELAAAIGEIYAKYYYPFHHKTPQKQVEFSEQQAAEIAETARVYGFTDIQYALFHRTRTLSADAYCALLGTYSDHLAMDAPLRQAFFSEIKAAILAFGGTVTIYDTIDLELARKPAGRQC